MRKILKLFLAILAICILLACCGGTEEGEKPVSTQPNQTESVDKPVQTGGNVSVRVSSGDAGSEHTDCRLHNLKIDLIH